jgi:hypothetical protein
VDPVALGNPLVSDDTRPLVYPALGAVFHLEVLEPADSARLEAVTELVWAWFGDRLKWTNFSFLDPIEKADRGDADFITNYPNTLEVPTNPDPILHAALVSAAMFRRDEFEVAFNGGDDPASASPYSYRFYAEVPFASVGQLSPYAVVHITVPESWPVDDFFRRIFEIASLLRLRWGCAGYTYSPWIVSEYEDIARAMASHSRRHIGYDIAEYTRLVAEFHDRIRTVSWLNFLGGALADELRGEGRVLESASRLTMHPCGNNLLVQAGPAPERGDQNRLLYPPAYVEADILLRPRRAHDGKGMIFLGPWDETSITDWLRRFERRVN